jgi:hypothetical protein
MGTKRLSMRKSKEILRLCWEVGLSERKIARSQGVARSTVAEVLRRAREAGIGWPLDEGLDEEKLEQLLYPPARPIKDRPEPEWKGAYRELRSHKHVTLQLLWVEYRKACGVDGCRPEFCEACPSWVVSPPLLFTVDKSFHAPFVNGSQRERHG